MRVLCFISSVAKTIVLLGYEALSLGNWPRDLRDTAVVSQFGSQEPIDTAPCRRRLDKPRREAISL